MSITNETKFIVSYLIPGKEENDTKTTLQQKQFQRRFSHLFKVKMKEKEKNKVHIFYW